MQKNAETINRVRQRASRYCLNLNEKSSTESSEDQASEKQTASAEEEEGIVKELSQEEEIGTVQELEQNKEPEFDLFEEDEKSKEELSHYPEIMEEIGRLEDLYIFPRGRNNPLG